jgi:hypothetical protein
MSIIARATKSISLNGILVGEVESDGDIEADTESVRQFLKYKGLYKEVSIFQGMFNQAVAFANSSALLFERDLRRSPRKVVSVVPFVVNAAFSIELYLKALAQKHGVSLRGHELIKLNAALPDNALSEVQAVMQRCAANRALGEEPNFLAYLKSLNSTYIDWRYSYELEKTGPVHIEPTIFVMEVLHEACRLTPNA